MGDSPCSARSRGKAAGLGALGLAALLVLYASDPAHTAFYPHCPFFTLTGLYCPGCGTLRALHQVLHRHPVAAIGLNPLAVLFLPFLGYAFLCRIVHPASGRRMPTVFIPAVWIWILLGVIVAFGVLRNLPVYPFSLLAP